MNFHKLRRSSLCLCITAIFWLGNCQGDLRAQEQASEKSFTLKQAIEYALSNSVDMKNALLDQEIADVKVHEYIGSGLPQIDATVQITHSQPLQRMFFTLDKNNPIIGDDPRLSQLGLPDGSVIALPNFFQLNSMGDASLSASQLIFSGSYFVGLKAAKTYKELASKALEQTKVETIEAVSKAFYAVLINRERLELFNKNIERVDSLLKDTRVLYKNGFTEEIDLNRVQVALNNLKTEKVKFQNLMALAKNLLKFQMNYPMDQAMKIVGEIEDVNTSANLLIVQKVPTDYTERIEYSILETQRELQKLQVRLGKAAYLPTLSAFGKFGYATQSPDILGVFTQETEGIPEGFPVGPDTWYPHGVYGISLQIPIFNGLSRSYKLQQEKIKLLKVENTFNKLEASIDLQVNKARITLKNSLKTLEAQAENVELAEELVRVTRIKYLNGVGSNIELTQAETSLKEAQTNYYNALYELILAQIDLKVAQGTLDKDY